MQPYIGYIMLFGGNFAPAGWEFCEGQLMAISENETLFNLIGTTYGGDGVDTFALPDLRGRVAIHQGQGSGLTNRTLAEMAGSEEITLTQNQIPPHNHYIQVSSKIGTTGIPANNTYLATPYTASGDNATSLKIFNTTAFSDGPPANYVSLAPQVVGSGGGSQPMSIMQPVLAISYCISLFGYFPSPN
ncbi:MAG TPA: tail fiber protein [Mucilaginibacter sp.]|nr:tail fiber protein [Mucilaginibacter sp.]